ncbi:MAG: O-methyltransferase [Thermoleophilia bacterium]
MISLDGWEEIEEYALAQTEPPSDVLERLAAETRETMDAPQMMVGPLEGRCLEFLVRLARPQLVVELGTFTGYSSISMAPALPEGGRIITCDIDERAQAIAKRYAEEAGVADRIDYRLGPGLETIAGLDGPFDFVFIDADKDGYVDYYEAVLPKLADDGLIIADNVLWSGRVVDPEPDETTRTILAFNDHVRADERVSAVMLTVRDGMTLIRRRPPA